MNQRLTDRVAVITGAGTGIGVGIARRLAKEGASVVVSAASSIQGARDLADEIVASGGAALAVQADFRDPATAIDVVNTAVSNYGGIDVLVNNAGYTLDKPFLETTPDDWSSLFNINVQAMIASAHAAAPHMIERGGGRIINISSVHGALHANGHVIYGATKGAINAFTRALAVELAPHQITSNVIAPGAIYVERYDRDNRDLEAIRTSIPNQRLGYPEDIAGAAAYLASDEARYITGAILYIDGGVTSAMAVTD